jgi:hypothetical protein
MYATVYLNDASPIRTSMRQLVEHDFDFILRPTERAS